MTATSPVPRPAPSEFAQFYAGYVASVPDGDIVEILETQHRDIVAEHAAHHQPEPE